MSSSASNARSFFCTRTVANGDSQETPRYNSRLQPTAKRLGSGTATGCAHQNADALHLAFDFGAYSANNGNLLSQTITANSSYSWTQYYAYDGVNRLAMASEDAAITGSTCPAGATWCREYGYDHFGNRWISASLDTLHMATPTSQSTIDPATNRLTSGTYDAAGNMTAYPFLTDGGSMAYDANNKMTSFTKTGVSVDTKYDAAGRRVRKVYNGETTLWVYDAFGRLAAEYTTETQTTPADVYYRTTDHLGSTRVVTDLGGDVKQRRDFFPFGENIPADSSHGGRNGVLDGGAATYNASLSVRQQFTGQQRDEETGLDYFWERCLVPVLARFSSVDPENAGASRSAPQLWNGYNYAGNNPLRYSDPTGRSVIDVLRGFWQWINGEPQIDPLTMDPLDAMILGTALGRPSDVPIVISLDDPVHDQIVDVVNSLSEGTFSQECRDLLAQITTGLDGELEEPINVDRITLGLRSVEFLPGQGETRTFADFGVGETPETIDNFFRRADQLRPETTFVGIPGGPIFYDQESTLPNDLLQGVLLHEGLHSVGRVGDADIALGFGLISREQYDAIRSGSLELSDSVRNASQQMLQTTCIPPGGF